MNSKYTPSLESLAQYLSARCTTDEKARIERWLAEDPEHTVYLNQLKSEWSYLEDSPIRLSPERRSNVWAHIYKRLTPGPKMYVFTPKYLWYSGVAVVVVAAFLGGLLTFFIQNTTLNRHLQNQLTIVKTNMGQKSEVLLPDGSVVWLNAGSKISYSNTFNQNERNVTLEGEAFFDVKKNEAAPFVVHTPNLNVVVKGTAFDVSAYAEDGHTEVSLLRGKVDIYNKKGKLVRKLLPNDLMHYDKAKDTYALHRNNNALQYSAWKDEELIFENAPLDMVVKKLERWYGVEIDWQHAESAKRYTFKVKTESLREMLQLINVITPIDYRIVGREVRVTRRQKN